MGRLRAPTLTDLQSLKLGDTTGYSDVIVC